MDLLNTIIESKRLKLVSITTEYTEVIFKEFTPKVTKYMSPAPPERIEDTKDFINSSIKKMIKGEELQLVILNRITNEFLGLCGSHHINSSTPTLGIWIKINAHGNRFGREAVLSLKTWCDKNLNYKYLTYQVDERNLASRKIAESLGGIIKKRYKRKNLSGKTVSALEYWI